MASGDTLFSIDPAEGGVDTDAPQDTNGAHSVRKFDADTVQTWIMKKLLPLNYAGGGLTLRIRFRAATAITGNVDWEASIERNEADVTDLDADSFAAAQSVIDAAPGNLGDFTEAVITFTDGALMDSLAAGENFRLKIERDADDGSDTMLGGAQIVWVVGEET